MRWFYKLPLRLRSLFRKSCVEQDLSDELRFHVEKQIEEYVTKGMTRQEARYAALRELGGVEQTKEVCRDMRRMNTIENFFQDLRYGLRQLRRSPGFTAVAVLTLSLGIGANTAIFSLLNAVLLRPLPYPEPGKLVHAQWLFTSGDVPSVTGTEYAFWKEHGRVFDAAATHDLFPAGFNLLSGAEPEYVKGLKVSRDFFRVLGVQPILGRGFSEEEDRPKGPNAVILSHGLWRRRFASDPGIVGRAITLNSESYSVAGVMPESFRFVLPYAGVVDVEAWVPLRLAAEPHDQGHDYCMLARLKPGVGLEQAQSDMARVLSELRQDFPGHVAPGERGMFLIPYQRWVTGEVRAPLLILFAAVGLVLLIATVNVANMILARAVSRQPEVAVRLALGASRGRVLSQMLTEDLVLAFLGGAVALAFSPWVGRVLLAISPQALPLPGEVRVDFRVGGFTFILAAMGGVAAGLAPALRASRVDLSQSIKEGGRARSLRSGHQRLRKWLVTGEVALSAPLLTGATLLIFSLVGLERVRPGFNPENLWTFHLSLSPQKLKTASATWDFEQRALARLEALPGVESVGVVSSLPLEPGLNGEVRVRSGDHEARVYIETRSASPGYFRTMQIPVLQGRGLRDSDTAASVPVVMVNQAFVRKCCPGHNAIGGQVFLNIGRAGDVGREVVGIVGDTKEAEEGIAGPAPPMVFVPPAQLDDDLSGMIYFGSLSSWAVRSKAPLGPREVQHAVAQADRGEAVAGFAPMTRLVGESIAPSRFVATVVGVFAGIASLLAAVGIFGVISYSVAERTHEIGLRMALGAERRNVLGMVIRQGLNVALTGTAIGLALAVAFTRFLRDLLFGVRPVDPMTFCAVPLALIFVALAAAYLPARRATKVDPMVALRYE